MKLLHTSDWHLGASLGPEKRTAEFEAALDWLLRTIAEEKIEAVIIAGDVFDSALPSNSASGLYYRFISGAREAGVRTLIVTAGNHDSASFLEAPRELLRCLNVTVIGQADSENYDAQIVPLRDSSGALCAAVCAVPFLRDRDIRRAVSGETAEQQQSSRQEGILRHYRGICTRAAELYPGIPLIATGHFYAAGGTVSGSHSIGTLTGIPVSGLPENISYLALGHLHTPQTVGGRPNFRYSGSLLRMSFGDHDAEKTVLILDSECLSDPPRTIPIPVFQHLEKITGDLDAIRKRIEELKKLALPVRVSIENTGNFEPQLPQLLAACCGKSAIRVISCRNQQENPVVRMRRPLGGKQLNELTPELVFRSLLDERSLPPDRREALLRAFREAEQELAEADAQAE